ncbi:MAG: 4-phosphopantetheinyl transferase family protein [Pirellulales bacterium]|nr:4-phosphopantetheinyl transferase family protein [Pirellulales bacterium]
MAVSSTSDVGVDVESLDQTMVENPADMVLSPAEHDWLESRPSTLRDRDFIKLWTVKEAYAKMIGRGIDLDFSSFEIAMEPLRIARSETGAQFTEDIYLTTQEISMHDGLYQLSLAAECTPLLKPEVVIHDIESQQIESDAHKLLRAG